MPLELHPVILILPVAMAVIAFLHHLRLLVVVVVPPVLIRVLVTVVQAAVERGFKMAQARARRDRVILVVRGKLEIAPEAAAAVQVQRVRKVHQSVATVVMAHQVL